jgi:ribosome biogenesis protein ENP2
VQILTEDYSKSAFLCTDRTVSFHARFGTYYKMRVPKFGRDLAYAPFTAELLISGSSSEVYRISLEEGRFMQPLACRSPAINATGEDEERVLEEGKREEGEGEEGVWEEEGETREGG